MADTCSYFELSNSVGYMPVVISNLLLSTGKIVLSMWVFPT